MGKEQNVFNFYKACNKLKNVIRTGWVDWKIKRDRLESVAEHIYGTQMLAIAMKSEYEYNIDIMKVIYMLAIHELGEAIIGDFVFYAIDAKEKEELEHKAVHDMLDTLIDSEYIEELFKEFDARETKEAIFAYQCDKLECDLQCRLYDLEGCSDIEHDRSEKGMQNDRVRELVEQGMSLSKMWITFDMEKIPYDENFKSVDEYAMNEE